MRAEHATVAGGNPRTTKGCNMQAVFTIKSPHTIREDGLLPSIAITTENTLSPGFVSLQIGTPDDRFGPVSIATTTLLLAKSEARAVASALMGAAAEL